MIPESFILRGKKKIKIKGDLLSGYGGRPGEVKLGRKGTQSIRDQPMRLKQRKVS
jgi:hypothetical protein